MNGSSSPRSARWNHSMKLSAEPSGPFSKARYGQCRAICGRPGSAPRTRSSMLGWVAAVSATDSPSQLRPPFIQRMCSTFAPSPSGGTSTSRHPPISVDIGRGWIEASLFILPAGGKVTPRASPVRRWHTAVSSARMSVWTGRRPVGDGRAHRDLAARGGRAGVPGPAFRASGCPGLRTPAAERHHPGVRRRHPHPVRAGRRRAAGRGRRQWLHPGLAADLPGLGRSGRAVLPGR